MNIEQTVDAATRIVAAYLTGNRVAPSEIPKLFADTHAAVVGLATGQVQAAAAKEANTKTPQEIRKSITHDALISFEDGKRYKTLRRHLTTMGLTPETYRAKYGLPADYPMTSAAYSERRADLARANGLGQRRADPAAENTSPSA